MTFITFLPHSGLIKFYDPTGLHDDNTTHNFHKPTWK